MKLADYLSRHGITEKAFGELISASQAAINRYKRGRVPTPEHMRSIIEKTGGAVTPNDFFDVPGQGDEMPPGAEGSQSGDRPAMSD